MYTYTCIYIYILELDNDMQCVNSAFNCIYICVYIQSVYYMCVTPCSARLLKRFLQAI